MQKIWGKSYFGLNTGPMLFEGISIQQKKIPLVTLPNRFSSKATKKQKINSAKNKKIVCKSKATTLSVRHYRPVHQKRTTLLTSNVVAFKLTQVPIFPSITTRWNRRNR